MAYHPQTDSQTKQVNQCVEQYLRNFCSYQQDDWVDWLGVAEFHYNHLIHDSTRVSPFYTNYGFNPSFSIPRLHQSLTPATSDFLSHLSIICSELMAELKLAQESAKLKYDAVDRETCSAMHYQPKQPKTLLVLNQGGAREN